MNFVAAALFAISTAVLTAIALAFGRGGLNPSVAGIALGAGGIVAAFSIWQQRETRPPHRPITGTEWVVIVMFILFALRAFGWLVFADGDSIKVLSPNNLGDLSLHLTYIRYLANGAPFWPENPIFAGGSLTYPIGMDLFNSLLSLLGVNDLRGLIWLGLAGSALTGIALWRWGGAFTLAGFLFNGGIAGLAIFRDGHFADFQSELAWKSIPLALFVTQRGLLFALPAGLLLLCSWRARLFSADPDAWRLPRWGEVLLYASLPIFHFHTFLFLSIVLAVWFVAKPDARRHLVFVVGAAFIPASFLVLLVTGFFKGASILGWKPGWMQDDENFFVFWFLNFGVLPLFVAALSRKMRSRDERLWPGSLVFTGVGVFLLCCFVKFAPWEWDNTKLMLWSYLAVLPYLWSHVIAPLPWLLRALSCVGLFFSGFVSLVGGIDGSHTGHEIATRSQLDDVAAAVRGIPITERFIGYATYNHPLLLNGRPMALGYPGHAWSHGLDWRPTSSKVDAVLRGRPDWRELCAELGVRYLIWGTNETENVRDSLEPWRSGAAPIRSGEWGVLYDLTLPAPVPQLSPLEPEPPAASELPPPQSSPR